MFHQVVFELEHKIQPDGTYKISIKIDGKVVGEKIKSNLNFASSTMLGRIHVKLGFADGHNLAAKCHIKEFFYTANELED